MAKLDKKILYLSFHNSLRKKFGINRVVTKKEIIIKLGRQFLVPKHLREDAINELERMELLEKVDRNNIKILDCDICIEKIFL